MHLCAQFLHSPPLTKLLAAYPPTPSLDSFVIQDLGSALLKRAIGARFIIERYALSLGEKLQKHWEEGMYNLGRLLDSTMKQSHDEDSTPQLCVDGPSKSFSCSIRLIETLDTNQVVLIQGPPGSGKSTRIPASLLAAHPDCKILVSEPRRIAAISLAEYQRRTLPEELADKVSYAVRFQSTVAAATKLVYQTDGVTLQYLLEDPCLLGVSYLLIDEIHERSSNQLLILAITLRILKYNPQLRVILMSATIDEQQILRYVQRYARCASLSLNATQHSVSTTFLPCKEDYIQQVLEEVFRIHTSNKNPDDGILVFLSGSDDIMICLALLYECQSREPQESSIGFPFVVVPFHSRLSIQQMRYPFGYFPGKRKVVLATNVAETSITIPGICYVIDTGLQKRVVFLPEHSTSVLVVMPITRPTYLQRKGRVGRTQNGICTCLYPKIVVEQEMLPDPHSDLRFEAIDQLLLMLLSFMKRFKAEFSSFPFTLKPTDLMDPIEPYKLDTTIALLYYNYILKDHCLNMNCPGQSELDLSIVGLAASYLPVSLHMTLFLLVAQFYGVEHEACMIAAGIETGVGDWLGSPSNLRAVQGSDHLSILHALMTPEKKGLVCHAHQQAILIAKQLEEGLARIHMKYAAQLSQFLKATFCLPQSVNSELEIYNTEDLIQLCLVLTHHMTMAQRSSGGFRTLFSGHLVNPSKRSACANTSSIFLLYDHSVRIAGKTIAVCCTEVETRLLKLNKRIAVGTPTEVVAACCTPNTSKSKLGFRRSVKA